jgi:hypothetical protein
MMEFISWTIHNVKWRIFSRTLKRQKKETLDKIILLMSINDQKGRSM